MYSTLHPPPRRGAQRARSFWLLGRLREGIRYRRYSLRTEQAYVYWALSFIRWSGGRHRRLAGGPAVEECLPDLPCMRLSERLLLDCSDVCTARVHTHVRRFAASAVGTPLVRLPLPVSYPIGAAA